MKCKLLVLNTLIFTGQTLKVAGLDLTSHGQLYVAASRDGSPKGLFVLAPDNKMKNIVLQTSFGVNLIQGWATLWSPGMVNFVPAVAYHFYLNLPEKSCNLGTTF